MKEDTFRKICPSNGKVVIFGLGIHSEVTGWTVRGPGPDGGEIFHTCPDRLSGAPGLLYNGYRVFPGSKEAGACR